MKSWPLYIIPPPSSLSEIQFLENGSERMIFHLYRLKIEQSIKPPLFKDPTNQPRDIILAAIERIFSQNFQKAQSWRIGNIHEPTQNTIFFAFGKITRATHGFYDESRGDFIEETFEEAPHTYVAIDLEHQICAIAQKAKIAPRVRNIARNLEKLLNAVHQTEMEYHDITFTLNEINDPEEFITLIRTAVCISKFEMTFSPPNPFDAEEQFQRPMEELLKWSHADKGQTSIKGQNLEPNTLEKLSRSAAASGNNARAHIQSPSDTKPVPKKLAGNTTTVTIDDIVTDDQKFNLIQKIRSAYLRVRDMRE